MIGAALRTTAAAIGTVVLAGCTVFGVRSGTEQVSYTVVEALAESIEVRRYAPRLVAETIVAAADEESGRNAAFRALFDYISGENRSATKVAMTAPVETAAASGDRSETIAMTAPVETLRSGEGRFAMRFFLPAGTTPETAPVPLNPKVTVFAVPERTLAVLRFTGSTAEDAVARQVATLEAALATSRWQPAGEPMAMFYDPPWTLPFLRRNEVAIPVSER